MGHVRHLYLHLPFCAHRCGYCDFVTVVGRHGQHAAYVDALLAELELEGAVLAENVETVFLGGGTPTVTEPAALARLLAGLPVTRADIAGMGVGGLLMEIVSRGQPRSGGEAPGADEVEADA